MFTKKQMCLKTNLNTIIMFKKMFDLFTVFILVIVMFVVDSVFNYSYLNLQKYKNVRKGL